MRRFEIQVLALLVALTGGAAIASAQQSAGGNYSNYSGGDYYSGVGGGFAPWSFYVNQSAAFVTNVTLPGVTRQNPVVYSFLDGANDVFAGVPSNLMSGGLASGITNNIPGATGTDNGGLPLIPNNTLTNTVTTLLPGGVTDFLSGLLSPGQPTTISVTPAFQDDWRFETTGGVFYQLPLGDNVSFTTGLNYYQALHPSAEQFDYQAPSLSGQLGMKLTGRIVTSFYYQYEYDLLRGQTFASINRFGSNTIYAPNDRWLLQYGSQYGQNSFQAAPAFTSSNQTFNFSALRFLGSQKSSYLVSGYSFAKADAAVNAFSYDANTLYAGARWLFGPTGQNDLQLFSSLALYGFDNPDVVQTTTVRNDHNAAYSARLARWITPTVNVYSQYAYFNNDSNITRQNYDSSIISFGGMWIR